MKTIEQVLDRIQPVDRTLEPAIQAHLDCLTKPRGSLGMLEEFAMRYCLATGSSAPVLGKKRILCFAGDHGVADEGTSAYPKEVTPQMVRNMAAGGAAVNVLTRHVGAELAVIDVGVNAPLDDVAGVLHRKIRCGTGNIARGPAMSLDEARKAIETGIELADNACDEGVTIVGTGDMGIANTTPSSALFAALLPSPVEEVTGRGTGIDNAGLARKTAVIKKALDANRERLGTPLNCLAAVGGLEIAAICGVILGAASRRIPVVVDGFISSAGALVAWKMCSAVRDYMFFSHLSDEKGHGVFLRSIGDDPILNLRMRLGEGTGAALAMSIIEAAVKIYNEMATFGSAGVSDKE